MDEFQEVDVMWPDNIADDDLHLDLDLDRCRAVGDDFSLENGLMGCDLKAKESSTKPINILCTQLSFIYSDDSDDGDDFMREMVPPHILVSKRIAGEGRPLKGRRLSEVRNSILRMTGFLET